MTTMIICRIMALAVAKVSPRRAQKQRVLAARLVPFALLRRLAAEKANGNCRPKDLLFSEHNETESITYRQFHVSRVLYGYE
jgi:hypothetical protein